MKKEQLLKLLEISMRAADTGVVSKLDTERADNLKMLLRASTRAGTANLGAALRALLLSDQDLFEETAYLQSLKNGQKGIKFDYFQQAYNRFAKPDETGKTAFQRASEIQSDAGGGNNDFSTLFVEQIIKKRIEAESELLQYLDQKRLSTTTGKFPKSSNLAKAAFATKNANLTDITSTVDAGFGHITVEAQKFGGLLFLNAETFVKLDAQTVSQIIDELTIAFHRGMIDQVVNGDGNAPNATGLATNATAVSFNGNITQTLIKMIAAVADVTRGGSTDIFIMTNTAGKTTLLAEKFINPAYDNLIEVVNSKLEVSFIRELKIIEENVITTSGSTPNKTAPLYVGKRGDYLMATQTDPQIMIDPYGDFQAGGERIRIMNFWTGQPYFNDSFAKTTIPTVY